MNLYFLTLRLLCAVINFANKKLTYLIIIQIGYHKVIRRFWTFVARCPGRSDEVTRGQLCHSEKRH